MKETRLNSFSKYNVVLRPAKDSDAAGLIRLVGACFKEYEDEGVFLDLEDLDSDLYNWATFLENKGGQGFVLVDSHDVVIGCAGFVCAKQGIFELKRFYLQKNLRGSGLAKDLLKFIEAKIKDQKGKELFLWSDSRFLRAHRFYEKYNFIKLKKTRELFDISKSIEIKFQKIYDNDV